MEALRTRLLRLRDRPLLVAAIIVAGYLAIKVPRLSDEPMEGPDMPVILGLLRADHSPAALSAGFTGPWMRSGDYYRPLITVLDWTDYRLWGEDPRGWRLTNAILIAATMLALAWLCREGLARPWAGPIAAALLPCYRVAGEATFWPAWRTDVVSGLFLCLATGAALSYLREGRADRLGLTLGMFVLALLAKEVAFIWPAFLAVAVLILGRRRRGLMLLAAVTGVAGLLWLLRTSLLGLPLLGAPVLIVDFSLERQLFQFAHLLFGPLLWDLTITLPLVMSTPDWWFTGPFWSALAADGAFLGVNLTALWMAPRLWGVLWAWRAIMYLPSMPFARIFLFYFYVPTLGTVLLYAVGLVSAVQLVQRHRRTHQKCGLDHMEVASHAR